MLSGSEGFGGFRRFLVVTPRVCGGVKRLVLSVHLSVCLSVCLSVVCLCTQKSGYLAIYRVKRLLNTTVTLKSKKKCPGVYLIVAKAVPFAASTALSFLTTVHSAILIRSQLEYDRGRAYTDSGHAFILAISHAHRYAYSSAVHSACGYAASDIHFTNYSIDPVCSPARSKL